MSEDNTKTTVEIEEETAPETADVPEEEKEQAPGRTAKEQDGISETKEELPEAEGSGDAAGEEPDGEEAPEEAAETGTGKRFWQKQNRPVKKDKKDVLIEELNDKVQRQLAEFENFRKRTEKEKAQNYMIGARDVLEKMLPILDNFERGLENADLSDPFAEGMDKVYKQLATALESLGVTPIESVGKEFDPNLHNAVMHIEDENFGENIVAEEFQKGYMYKDTVLRYSMVKVAN